MDPPPDFGYDSYKGNSKLKNKVYVCNAPPFDTACLAAVSSQLAHSVQKACMSPARSM